MEVDVVIIGAGPAGALCATLLARRGVSVALLDRDRFPRSKVCGEFISYDGLAALDLAGLGSLVEEKGASTITSARLFVADRKLEFGLPHPARGLSRDAFDAALVERARTEGAHIVEGTTVEAIEYDSAGAYVVSSEAMRLRGRVVVGAWGRWGRLDRQLRRTFARDRSTRHFGFKRHYASGAPHGSIDLYSFDRGYLGVAGVEEGRMNVCGLVHEARLAGMRGRWAGFAAELAAESESLRALLDRDDAEGPFLSSDPVIFAPRESAVGDMLLIGDSAAMIDPLTGNGMSLALQSALLAAPFVIRQLAREGDIARHWQNAYRSHFAGRLRWSRAAARLLSKPAALMTLLKLPFSNRLAEFFVRGTRASLQEVERLATVRF